jgi:hypothetical protein
VLSTNWLSYGVVVDDEGACEVVRQRTPTIIEQSRDEADTSTRTGFEFPILPSLFLEPP